MEKQRMMTSMQEHQTDYNLLQCTWLRLEPVILSSNCQVVVKNNDSLRKRTTAFASWLSGETGSWTASIWHHRLDQTRSLPRGFD